MSSYTHAHQGALSHASTPTAWTPAHHVSVSQSKPVRLLELGTGPHGRNALLEFPEGWTRSIDLVTEPDAWHPLFDGLPQADKDSMRQYLQPESIRQQDGTYLQRGALSFITRSLSRRRAFLTHNLFDVPAEHWSTGNAHGYRCAAEMLEALARGHGPHIDVFGILAEVAKAAHESRNGRSRRGAAHAFMEIVGAGLTFMAKHGKHGSFVAQKIATAEHYASHWAEVEARERTQFIQRMQEARRRKRAARQGGAA